LKQKIHNNNNSLRDVDIILVNCGLHDIKVDLQSGAIQIPLEDYKKNLTAIVDLIQTSPPPPTKLVWIRTTPLDEQTHNAKHKKFHRHENNLKLYNQAADEIMAKQLIPSIDLHRFTGNLRCRGALFCDHVHFHGHVREKQGAFIAGWLTSSSSTMMM
jgi:hypothetical protein